MVEQEKIISVDADLGKDLGSAELTKWLYSTYISTSHRTEQTAGEVYRSLHV